MIFRRSVLLTLGMMNFSADVRSQDGFAVSRHLRKNFPECQTKTDKQYICWKQISPGVKIKYSIAIYQVTDGKSPDGIIRALRSVEKPVGSYESAGTTIEKRVIRNEISSLGSNWSGGRSREILERYTDWKARLFSYKIVSSVYDSKGSVWMVISSTNFDCTLGGTKSSERFCPTKYKDDSSPVELVARSNMQRALALFR